MVKTAAFGAFVSLVPGQDGLVHISKLGNGKRIAKVEDVVKVGDKLQVEITDIDARGKISLVPVKEGDASGFRRAGRGRVQQTRERGTARARSTPVGRTVRRHCPPYRPPGRPAGDHRGDCRRSAVCRSASGSASAPGTRRRRWPGSSHFLEHLLFKGTSGVRRWRSPSEIEAVGGETNAFTGKEYTCYYARVLDTDLPLAVDVVLRHAHARR